jgi:hypothetical protein
VLNVLAGNPGSAVEDVELPVLHAAALAAIIKNPTQFVAPAVLAAASAAQAAAAAAGGGSSSSGGGGQASGLQTLGAAPQQHQQLLLQQQQQQQQQVQQQQVQVGCGHPRVAMGDTAPVCMGALPPASVQEVLVRSGAWAAFLACVMSLVSWAKCPGPCLVVLLCALQQCCVASQASCVVTQQHLQCLPCHPAPSM